MADLGEAILAVQLANVLDRAVRSAQCEISTAAIERSRLIVALATMVEADLDRLGPAIDPNDHPSALVIGVREMLAKGPVLRGGSVCFPAAG